TLSEGNSGTKDFVFTVTQSAVSPVNTTVVFGTANGTALSGSDYTAAAGTLTIASGSTTGAITIAAGAGTGTIQNDDFSLGIAATSAAKPEGNSGNSPFTFTVTRSGNTNVA